MKPAVRFSLTSLGFKWLLVTAILALCADLIAQELRLRVSKTETPDGLVIEFTGEANTSYWLVRGSSLLNINTLVETKRVPVTGLVQFTIELSTSASESFYRIQQIDPT